MSNSLGYGNKSFLVSVKSGAVRKLNIYKTFLLQNQILRKTKRAIDRLKQNLLENNSKRYRA